MLRNSPAAVSSHPLQQGSLCELRRCLPNMKTLDPGIVPGPACLVQKPAVFAQEARHLRRRAHFPVPFGTTYSLFHLSGSARRPLQRMETIGRV